MEAASKVRGAYDDFVLGVWVNARFNDTVEETIEFIKSNREARTDEVLEFMDWVRFKKNDSQGAEDSQQTCRPQ